MLDIVSVLMPFASDTAGDTSDTITTTSKLFHFATLSGKSTFFFVCTRAGLRLYVWVQRHRPGS